MVLRVPAVETARITDQRGSKRKKNVSEKADFFYFLFFFLRKLIVNLLVSEWETTTARSVI